MALDSLWYYSRENLKRGPVTSSEMHRLAHKEKIRPDDLVWCHGMESWVPARTIRGMFPEDDDAGLLTDMFEAPQSQMPVTSEPDPDEPPNLDRVNIYDQPQVEPAPETATTASLQWLNEHGRKIIVGSFIFLLFCSGSEMVGKRHVARQKAMFDLAKLTFADQYDTRIAAEESTLFTLQAKPTLSNEEAALLRATSRKLTSIKNERAIEMAKLETNEWSKLRMSAHSTETSFTVWSYYRHIFILLGGTVLAVGLFARFFSGQKTEKWFCLIVLCLMAAGIFLGGMSPASQTMVSG